MRQQRKLDHVNIAGQCGDGPLKNGFEHIHLLNNSIPELNYSEIDLKVKFLGKTLNAPLLINALTGGTEQARKINHDLAFMAHKYGLAMAVGSQIIAVDNDALKESFTVVREVNQNGLVFANVGANTDVAKALQVVEMIAADALQLHFNVPQELAMSEGDRNFKGIIDNVKQIVDNCPVPVIAKEVGFGFSRESAARLYTAGVRLFDCGGQGGTNFIAIEDKRGGLFNNELDEWGIPSAVSLAEILALQLPVNIIASGGIRKAGDAVKAIAMGADLVGMAGPFLKVWLQGGINELDKFIASFIYRMKAVFLMTGSKNIRQIRKQPILILKDTAERLLARGIDPAIWSRQKP